METGISIVLDQRTIDAHAQPLHVTALFNDVDVDTAVGVLANMVGLKVVALDRVLYVTKEENANKLLAQQQQRRAPPDKSEKKRKKPADEKEKKKAVDKKMA